MSSDKRTSRPFAQKRTRQRQTDAELERRVTEYSRAHPELMESFEELLRENPELAELILYSRAHPEAKLKFRVHRDRLYVMLRIPEKPMSERLH